MFRHLTMAAAALAVLAVAGEAQARKAGPRQTAAPEEAADPDAIASATAPSDPADADREQIRARLGEWVGAMIARDPAAMDKVLARDFQAVTYGGRLLDRPADIATMTALPGFGVKAVATRELDIRVYGDAAVVRGSVVVVERRGEALASVPMRITQTWIRQAGDWRLAADQSTRIEQQAAEAPADATAPAAPASPD